MSNLRFEYTLRVVTTKNIGLEQITDQAAAALAAAGVLATGDYVENPQCVKVPTDESPRYVYRTMVELPNAEQSGKTTFFVEWGGTANMTVSEVWPDGDAPENPTVDDVIAVMKKSRNLRRLAQEWNLDLQGVEVNGRDSGLR